MADAPTFEKFPKMARLKRHCVITEKLDGTNGQIVFNEDGDILTGSRNRIIVPGDDNYGFAAWAWERKDALFDLLGSGRHYGEWWGRGIQRNYGMDTKQFSLFNTARWMHDDISKLEAIDGLNVVPVLYTGLFADAAIDASMDSLRSNGSLAAPGFMNPEGVVTWHSATRAYYKRTFDHDETGKPE